MIKIIGALFIIISCIAFGYQSVLKKRETIAAIRELRDTVSELSHAIGFQLEALPDAICRLNQDMPRGEDSFLNRLSVEISLDPTKPLSALWNQVSDAFSEQKHLPKKVTSLVKALGESLGKMDYQTEITRLNQGTEALSEILASKESENEKTEQMVKSLSVLLGVFLVILFL